MTPNRTPPDRRRMTAIAVLVTGLLYAGAFSTTAALAYEHHIDPTAKIISLG